MNKTKKIMVWNSKGGVGKTTTVINLSSALSRLGKKTLMVDLGFQNNITEWLDINSEKKSILDYAIANFDIRKFNSKDEDISESEFIIPVEKNLYLLRLVNNTEVLADMINKEYLLGDIRGYLKVLFDKYKFDFVIFDSAPEITDVHKQVMQFVNEIFVPCSMEYSSVRGVMQVMKLTNGILGDMNKITRVIPTFIDFRNRKTTDICKLLISEFGKDATIKYKIRICNKLSVAVGFRKNIFDYSDKCTGARDYLNLAQGVINNEIRNNIRKSI